VSGGIIKKIYHSDVNVNSDCELVNVYFIVVDLSLNTDDKCQADNRFNLTRIIAWWY
jgi:hypothetical protein